MISHHCSEDCLTSAVKIASLAALDDTEARIVGLAFAERDTEVRTLRARAATIAIRAGIELLQCQYVLHNDSSLIVIVINSAESRAVSLSPCKADALPTWPLPAVHKSGLAACR